MIIQSSNTDCDKGKVEIFSFNIHSNHTRAMIMSDNNCDYIALGEINAS